MKRTTKIAIGASTVVVALGALTGIGLAGSGDDQEAAITGSALDTASRAALDHIGSGHVTDTEVGDEESYYEVEVTRPDGTQVDVQLDKEFNVVGSEGDGKDDEGSEQDD